jgi:DNA-binding response OmpR family regulator
MHGSLKRNLNEKIRTEKVKKILLIDVNRSSALANALAEQGHDLLHCDSVQRAWKFTYPHRPDIIILHLRDSNRAALSDLQECRALAKGVPIIAAMAANLNRALIKPLQHGAAAVLATPPTPESLRESLHGVAATMRE